MMELLVSSVVLATGLYFIGLGFSSLLTPGRASRFLLAFASSAVAHYVELLLRAIVGAAFVLRASSMLFPSIFSAFGWILLTTTAGLFLTPWRWHHRFAKWAVPRALRYLPLLGAVSLLLGVLILIALFAGPRG